MCNGIRVSIRSAIILRELKNSEHDGKRDGTTTGGHDGDEIDDDDARQGGAWEMNGLRARITDHENEEQERKTTFHIHQRGGRPYPHPSISERSKRACAAARSGLAHAAPSPQGVRAALLLRARRARVPAAHVSPIAPHPRPGEEGDRRACAGRACDGPRHSGAGR